MSRELSVGEMAELNGVTVKALHLYHKNGLLPPSRVDQTTGYRYYTIGQCSTIDMIKRLQGMGMTLEEIRDVVAAGEDAVYSKIEECVTKLDSRILDLEIARNNARKILDARVYRKGAIVFDSVMLERLGRPRVLTFPVHNPRCADLDIPGVDYLDEWELNLRMLREEMAARNIPLGLFNDVGCIISKEELLSGRLRLSAAYVFVEGPASRLFPNAGTLPGGMNLTLYKDHYVEADGSNAEAVGIRKLLRYAEEHGFEVAGDYSGRIIRDSPAFDYQGRDMLIKLQLPVTVREQEGAC